MKLNKRDLLLALAALSASAALPALAQSSTLDLSAGRDIGRAYLAANPNTNLEALRLDLLPAGFDAQAGSRLRTRASEDFREARIFIFKGWRLSETEARLFTLLAA
jgi:hypothetical protein